MDHLPSPDSVILGILCDQRATAQQPMPTAEVARRSGLDQPTLTAALERLIQQGLVSRHAALGAAPSVGLTEWGRQVC